MSRMMQSVPDADVVLRNPTHFAVALKYDGEKDIAPIVVAKGQDEIALRIVKIAEENGVQVRKVEYIVRNFASELPDIPTMRKKKKDASEEDYDKLRAEVTRLRKELRQEKMRSEALDTMIDVAEEMFNIPVRKKAGTKQ